MFNELLIKKKNYILLRKHRASIKGLPKNFKFLAGDIIKLAYGIKNYYLVFEGICLSKKKKNYLSLNTSFILRNIILGVGTEMIFAYFCKRLYNLRFQDYKRKFMFIKRNKLFFLRNKKNKHSKII